MSLQDGLTALQQKKYPEAIAELQFFCDGMVEKDSPYYVQCVIGLARSYRGNGEASKAKETCLLLAANHDPEVQDWVQSFLKILEAEANVQRQDGTDSPLTQPTKAGRLNQTGIRLLMPKVADSLSFASATTLFLMLGMVLAPCLAWFLIVDSQHPFQGLMIAIALAVVFNGVTFLVSPWLMDLSQTWLYKTRWVSLADIKQYSPEAVEVIQRVCRDKQIKFPRVGIIDDQTPTAFTYGSLPGQARLVVSQGLFTYLDNDEIAAVYAHELGHIVHWDFAVMTAASTLVQITFLIYIFLHRIARQSLGEKLGDLLQIVVIAAYVFHWIGTYLLLYLSRTREYYADHFAAETTGNPNGLSRALVKIAYGIVQEASNEPSRLLEGTRALGIFDPRTSLGAGTAYRVASDSQRIGRVFLWDLFNPWSGWLELNSTHPLTGKRLRALMHYTEQMGLNSEYSLAAVVREGNKLNKSQFYRQFCLDLALYSLPWLGAIAGLGMGFISHHAIATLGSGAIGWGIGLIAQALLIYPQFEQALDADIFSLMCDPYASPVRGVPVQLKGQLIGRGNPGNVFGSDVTLQDRTGMIYSRYHSRWGSLGNFLFGWKQVRGLIGESVSGVGWFRRGIAPTLDLSHLMVGDRTINSYPRLGVIVSGVVIIGLGIIIPRMGWWN